MKARQKTIFQSQVQLLFLAVIVLIAACNKDGQTVSLVPKTVDQDPTLPSIQVNGTMLHAEAFGNPDTSIIICLHGGPGGDYRDMLHCIELASQGYRVVLFDQRGSGLSQRYPQQFYENMGLGAIDMLINDLDGVINHYKQKPGQKVYLLGRSWGAMLASAYVGKYPNKINALAVLEPGGLKWADIKEYSKASGAFNFLSESFNDKTYVDQFVSGKENDQELLDYKMAIQAQENDITGEGLTAPGSFWRFGAALSKGLFIVGKNHEPDFSVNLKQFTVPVLFCYSEKNQAYGENWAKKIASAYSATELTYIPGTGHRGMISDATVWHNTTMPVLLNYLRRH